MPLVLRLHERGLELLHLALLDQRGGLSLETTSVRVRALGYPAQVSPTRTKLGEGEPEVSDEAWDRVMAEKLKLWAISALVADGSLPGWGKGRHLKVHMGAFDDLICRRQVLPRSAPLSRGA